MGNELSDMFWSSHESIEVDAGSATDSRMELGVDIVGAALEGLYLHPLGCQ